MSQVKLIVSNWKMNLNFDNSKILIENLINLNFEESKCLNIICPQFLLLPHISSLIKGSKLLLGAQDCHYKKNGAFTGDTSIDLIKKVGCEFIIVGHSERREFHNETDSIIRKKVDLIISEKIEPIICVGESKQQRKNNEYLNVLKNQLNKCVPENLEKVIIAYEPIWSIGTGKVPLIQEIIEIKNFVNEFVKKTKKISEVIFIYGGSVSSKNAQTFLNDSEVNGLLIGGASLKIEEIKKILTLG